MDKRNVSELRYCRRFVGVKKSYLLVLCLNSYGIKEENNGRTWGEFFGSLMNSTEPFWKAKLTRR